MIIIIYTYNVALIRCMLSSDFLPFQGGGRLQNLTEIRVFAGQSARICLLQPFIVRAAASIAFDTSVANQYGERCFVSYKSILC